MTPDTPVETHWGFGVSNGENDMTERKPFIAVNLTPALCGYFATYYTWSKGEAGIFLFFI